MATKVFGIGLSESGDVTLAACLRQLGYRPAQHDPDLVERVMEEGDLEALDVAALRHDSGIGVPWSAYYRRLDRRFPDARFILVVEDPSQSWFSSLRRHAVYAAGSIREHVYGFSRPAGQDGYGPESMVRHARQVQEYFAGRPHKLLVVCWAEERSWKRLCDFLGEPAPQVPLPHRSLRRAARVSAYFRRMRGNLHYYAQRVFTTD